MSLFFFGVCRLVALVALARLFSRFSCYFVPPVALAVRSLRATSCADRLPPPDGGRPLTSAPEGGDYRVVFLI